MNNLKKTLAVVLAIAVVFSMGIATSFAAFTDVPSTVNYAEAVNILSNLGIITGYEDGTFRPNNTITRAEVATIIVRAMNLSETQGATAFTDVPADHWAAGYINTAAQNGVINGMGDGTFAPGADVTYEQVVKMIVCALNYEIVASGKGGYPTGYLSVASSNGITSGAAGTVGQPATRATVAKLLYNALEVGMVEQSTFTIGGVGAEYKVGNDTLLSNLGVEKLEVVVTDSYLTADSYDSKDKTVTLVAAKKYGKDEDRDSNYIDEEGIDKGEELGEFVEGGTAAASLLGYTCVAYVGEDDETGDDTIFAISAKGTRNNVTVVKGNMFAPEEAEKEGKIYYWKNTKSDRKASTLTMDSDGMTVFVNYELVDDEYDTDYFDTNFSDGGVVTFIDNDNDGEVEYVIATKYTSEGVVESVEEEDGEWTFEALSGEIADYDSEDEDSLTLFIKGENYINVSEIAEGDTITAVECNNGITINYVSSDKIEGSVEGFDGVDEVVTISGKDYSISPKSEYSDVSSIKNKSGVFYLNADGLISYVDGSNSVGGEYGYITGVESDTKYSTTVYTVEIVDAKGNVAEYSLSNKVSVYGEEEQKNLKKSEAFEILEELCESDDLMGRVVRFTANGSNAISKIITAEHEDFKGAALKERAYDADDMSIGSDTFDANTVVFALDLDDDGEGYGDKDNVTVGNVSKFFVDEETYVGYAYGDGDGNAEVVLVINPETPVAADAHVFVVSSTKVIDIDGDDAVKLTGIKDGKTETVTIYDEDELALVDEIIDSDNRCTLYKGSVLLLGEADASGYVTDYEVLVLTAVDGNQIVAEQPELVAESVTMDKKKYVVQGIADLDVEATRKLSSGRIAVEGWSDYEVTYKDNGAVDKATGGYNVDTTNTKIVLVDATNTRLTAVEVKSSNVSGLRFKTSEAGCVYFRMYDVNSDANDLGTNRRDVMDLVGYKFDADDYMGGEGTQTPDEDETEIEEVIEETVEVEEAEDILVGEEL